MPLYHHLGYLLFYNVCMTILKIENGLQNFQNKTSFLLKTNPKKCKKNLTYVTHDLRLTTCISRTEKNNNFFT